LLSGTSKSSAELSPAGAIGAALRTGILSLPGESWQPGGVRTRRLPIFPLGAVLMPVGLLPIRIFEPRYLTLMDDLVGTGGADTLQLGVVGIERGSEVGGGEVRYRVGTLARLLEPMRESDGTWTVLLGGVGRFVVEEWLDDAPYPLGLVRELDEPGWDERDAAALSAAQVRTAEVLDLAVASGDLDEAVELSWAEDPAIAAWQVCTVAPVGPFDRQRLIEADTVGERLRLLGEQLDTIADVITFGQS
jgi:Lon protease-like protein